MGLRAVTLGPRLSGGGRGGRDSARPRHELRAPLATRARGRRDVPAPRRRGPRWSSSRRTARPRTPRQSSSPAPTPAATCVALCADHPFFSYDDWSICHDARRRGHPGRGRGAHRSRSATTISQSARGAVRGGTRARSRASCSSRSGPTPPRDGFLQRLQDLFRARRRPARPRRDDHRLPLAHRRSAGGVRRHPRPLDVRQGDRQRLRAVRTRRQARDHGARRPRPRPRRVFLLSTTHGARDVGLAAGDRDDATYTRTSR